MAKVTRKVLETILSEYAVAIINMAVNPNSTNDAALKQAMKKAAAALAPNDK